MGRQRTDADGTGSISGSAFDAHWGFFWIGLCILLLASTASALDAFHVDQVIDGDTVVLENKRRLRYIGIDAPEIYHKEKRAQPFGYASRDYNRQLINQKKIHLVFDREKTDRYGRLLAYVFNHKDQCLNQWLLLKGYATYLYRPPNTLRHQLLLNAQRTAMVEQQGIWAQWNDDAGATYVGSQRSRRFHRAACGFGKRIGPQNRRIFKTRWDAFWQGFAPCRQCMPARESVDP